MVIISRIIVFTSVIITNSTIIIIMTLKCSDDDLANVWENDRQTLWLLSRSFAGSNNINSSWIMINDGVHCHFRALSLPWLSNQGMIDDWKGDKPPGIIMGNPAGSSSWTRLSLHDTRAVKLCPRGKSLVNHYHTLGAQRWHHAANIDCFPPGGLDIAYICSNGPQVPERVAGQKNPGPSSG